MPADGKWDSTRRFKVLTCDFVAYNEHLLRTWSDTLVRTKQRKGGIIFGTWNLRSLYRAGSLTEASRELARYKLDLVGVQEVRWDKGGGTVRAGDYNFLYGKEMKITNREKYFV